MAVGGDGTPHGPIFFLSYAQAQPIRGSQTAPHDPNGAVKRLFDDLSAHVYELVGSPAGVDPGFMDQAMDAGTRWADDLVTALGTCQVFVPLISPRYVQSKWCAREWDAFSRRSVSLRSSAPAGNKTAILPVRWLPMPKAHTPAMVQKLLFFQPQRLKDPAIAQRYDDNGVYGLLAQQDEEAAYQAVVWRLAQQIRDIYHTYLVEPKIPPDPGQLRDSFRGDDE